MDTLAGILHFARTTEQRAALARAAAEIAIWHGVRRSLGNHRTAMMQGYIRRRLSGRPRQR